MRNNLLTLPRDTKEMPYVTLNTFGLGQTAAYTWESGTTNTLSIAANLENGTESVGWQVIIPDNSLIDIMGGGWTQSSISGNAMQYLNDQEISQASVWESNTGESTLNINRNNTTTQRSLTITFISKSTGAYKHFNITLPKYPV